MSRVTEMLLKRFAAKPAPRWGDDVSAVLNSDSSLRDSGGFKGEQLPLCRGSRGLQQLVCLWKGMLQWWLVFPSFVLTQAV